MWYFQRCKFLHWLILPIYSYTDCKMAKTMVTILLCFCLQIRLQNEKSTKILREKRKDKFDHRGTTYRIVFATPSCMLQNKLKIKRWYPNTVHIHHSYSGWSRLLPHTCTIERAKFTCMQHASRNLLWWCDDVAKMLELSISSTHFLWNQCR